MNQNEKKTSVVDEIMALTRIGYKVTDSGKLVPDSKAATDRFSASIDRQAQRFSKLTP